MSKCFQCASGGLVSGKHGFLEGATKSDCDEACRQKPSESKTQFDHHGILNQSQREPTCGDEEASPIRNHTQRKRPGGNIRDVFLFAPNSRKACRATFVRSWCDLSAKRPQTAASASGTETSDRRFWNEVARSSCRN